MNPESSENVPPVIGVLPLALQFLRHHWLKFVAISAVILIPCFWHRTIEAADLGSHLYNAWLVQLIERGQVARALGCADVEQCPIRLAAESALGNVFSLFAAEKIGVSIAVLIFFWGMFALVCATTRRAPWYLLPVARPLYVRMDISSRLFQLLSLAGAFVFLAWRFSGGGAAGNGSSRSRLLQLPCLLILWAWYCSLALPLYVGIAEIIPRRYQVLLFMVAAGSLFGVHQYFWHHYIVEASPFPSM